MIETHFHRDRVITSLLVRKSSSGYRAFPKATTSEVVSTRHSVSGKSVLFVGNWMLGWDLVVGITPVNRGNLVDD